MTISIDIETNLSTFERRLEKLSGSTNSIESIQLRSMESIGGGQFGNEMFIKMQKRHNRKR